MSIVVVSCDKYSDLWDDMFNLMDRFWPDRPYETFLATDTINYQRNGVKVIHFGNIREWMVCTRIALERIPTPYVLFLMDDYFMVDNVNNEEIEEGLRIVKDLNASFLNLHQKPVFLRDEDSVIVKPHIHTIPNNTRYGLDTAGAIWNKDFFIKQLYKEDGDAWRFESMLVSESLTDKGLEGRLFYDDRMPLHICKKEVVRLGKFTLDGIRIIEKTGYKIQSNRARMTRMEFWKDKLRLRLATIKHGRKFLKNVGRKLGFVFFTED